jgi:pimeloyl-ACP methyl ester carboxylesterase
METSNPRTIILLHGAGVSAAWWHPQVDALQGEYRVIAPDLPGHGALADQAFTLDAAIQRIGAVMDEARVPRAVLGGVSLGGYLAMRFAELYPERVVGLVLSGCTMNLSGMHGWGMAMTGWYLKHIVGAEKLEEGSIAGYRKRIAPEVLDPVLARGFFAKSAIDTFAAVSRRDYHRIVSRLSQPILVINGENDEPNRPAEAKFLKAANHARLIVLPDAGHLSNLEQPQAYTAALRTFADSLNWA